MITDPVTLILTSAVASAIVTATVNGFVTWKNQTRTINHQAEQTRLTLTHQADQTRQAIAQQADQTRLTLGTQTEQARLTDARALRDAKRERLRAIYQPVLAAAWAMNDLLIEQKIGYEGDTPEKVEARLGALRKQAGGDVNASLVALALERDVTAVHELFRSLRRDFAHHQRARFISTDRRDVDWDQVHDLEFRVQGQVTALERMARDQLAAYDRPLPAPEAAPGDGWP
jgi:hypothetical protein